MTKVVVNRCYGGFGLSPQATARYAELNHIRLVDDWHNHKLPFIPEDIKRDDPTLVQIVQELGEDANGLAADLQILTIPDNVKWTVQDYDGLEYVAEKHRSWS